jgi:hypothetical protein
VKTLLGGLIKLIVALCLAAFLYKGCQKLGRENQPPFVDPPSLDSWDPTDRYEAAHQIYKKYGGKEE